MSKAHLVLFLLLSLFSSITNAALAKQHLRSSLDSNRPIKATSFLSQGLGSKLLVGYWHNFDNGIGVLPLSQVSDAWDVIDFAFGETGADHCFVSFTPVYGTVDAFKAEIKGLQAKGKKVLLSLGGQNGVVSLPTATARQSFIDSIVGLVNLYGFDGIDVDLEHGMRPREGISRLRR